MIAAYLALTMEQHLVIPRLMERGRTYTAGEAARLSTLEPLAVALHDKHQAVLSVLLIIGYQMALGYWYHLGLAAAAMLSVYQQYLARERNPEQCFKASLNNNWLGAAVFAGIVIDYAT